MKIWLNKRCEHCGGNLYLVYDSYTNQYVPTCFQCSREDQKLKASVVRIPVQLKLLEGMP